MKSEYICNTSVFRFSLVKWEVPYPTLSVLIKNLSFTFTPDLTPSSKYLATNAMKENFYIEIQIEY